MKWLQLLVAWALIHISGSAMALDPIPKLPKVGATVYQYSADTVVAAREQGMVSAGGLIWNCQGSRCTISGPWPTPAVASCSALAVFVGAMRSYGHPRAQLNESELDQCNAGLLKAAIGVTGKSSGFVPAPILPSITPAGSVTALPQHTMTPAAGGGLAVKASPITGLAASRLQETRTSETKGVDTGPTRAIHANDLIPGAQSTPHSQERISKPLDLPSTRDISAALENARTENIIISAGTLRYEGGRIVFFSTETLRYEGERSVFFNAGTLRYSGDGR